ncbi:hypothetical protein [Anaerospora sp.]|uniref:hypothetical protein n=1 Tax=Anaerospora sp. TaxID=1960278 RepID=UPI00289C2DBE|nr:hypothetical protein [Anaerospora sp.]
MKSRSVLSIIQTVCIVLIIALCLFLPTTTVIARDIQNDPDGFNGITWGTSLDSLKEDFIYYRSVGTSLSYIKKNENFTLGDDTQFIRIEYGFNNNIFSNIYITFKGTNNYINILNWLTQQHGSSETVGKTINNKIVPESECWFGNNTTIILERLDVYQNGSLWMAPRKRN